MLEEYLKDRQLLRLEQVGQEALDDSVGNLILVMFDRLIDEVDQEL